MFGKKVDNKSSDEKAIKSITWQSLFAAVLMILIGCVLMIHPGIVKNICMIFGTALCVVGVVQLIIYFVSDVKKNYGKNKFIAGLCLIAAGLFVMIGYKIVMDIIPVVLGIFILVDGIIKLQTALNASKMDEYNHKPILVIAILTIIAGVAIIMFYSHIINFALRIVGAVMVFSGITDFVNVIYVGRKIRNYVKDMEALDR